MTLTERIRYCRLKIAEAATEPDWPYWLAEHEGLMVGAGQLSELECSDQYVTDDRMRVWFERGKEDATVLQALERITAAQGG